VDIEETDESFLVKLDLPGVRSEDASVDLRETELHVAGELKEPEREGQVRRQNRRTGRFDYRITLPGEVNPDAVEATLADGVLTVRLEKAPQAQPRRIDVKPGG
jgi:HSP20 family protein